MNASVNGNVENVAMTLATWRHCDITATILVEDDKTSSRSSYSCPIRVSRLKGAQNAVASAPVPTERITEEPAPTVHSKWEARRKLLRHRAETERLRVLVEFLSRPIHAHGGADPDPDIVTAYNLAVEAALQGIRRAALGDVEHCGAV